MNRCSGFWQDIRVVTVFHTSCLTMLKTCLPTLIALIALTVHASATPLEERGMATEGWRMHDLERPQPAFVDTGTYPRQAPAQPVPADAIELFADGLSGWTHRSGQPATWNVLEDGVIEIVPGKHRDIVSAQHFGDCQIHLEWLVPESRAKGAQNAGNSGLFIMNRYECQILNVHPEESVTYPDGMPGGVYGQVPPLVNPCRPAGHWNVYDIVFHRPHFDPAGKLRTPARVTVFLNGVLVLDQFELLGPTSHMKRAPWEAHPDRQPIRLQDHGNPVLLRNLWVRDLKGQ